MRFLSRRSVKDLDSWINKSVKVILHEDGYYIGILIAEQKNGLLIESSGKRIYIQYESITSLEEL